MPTLPESPHATTYEQRPRLPVPKYSLKITGTRLAVVSRRLQSIYDFMDTPKDARDADVACVGARAPRNGGRDKPGVRSTKSINNTIQYKYNTNPMSINLRECFAGDENIRCDDGQTTSSATAVPGACSAAAARSAGSSST